MPNASAFIATNRALPGAAMYPALTAARPETLRFENEAGGLISERAVRVEGSAGPAFRLERAEEVPGERSPSELISAQTLALEADGSVVLIASENADRGLTLRFDPPLAVAPPTLRRDQPFESRAAVREIDPTTGEATRSGTAEYRLELIGEDASSGVPLLLIRSRLEIRLGRSVVTRTTDRVYRVKNESGLVLEHETATQIVTAMGFTVSRSEQTIRASPD